MAWMFGSQLASENLIRAVHHFFSRKEKHVKRGCNATWGFQDFFWTILALRIVTLQKVQRKSLQGNPVVGWLYTSKFNQEVLWVTTNGIFAATQKESHCYSFWTLVNKDPLLILKVSIIKAFVSWLGPNLTSTHHLRCQHLISSFFLNANTCLAMFSLQWYWTMLMSGPEWPGDQWSSSQQIFTR